MSEGVDAAEEIFADEIEASFVPVPRPAVFKEIDGEAILVDEETRAVLTLNQIGGIVWQCLDGEVSLEQLTAELADAFGAPEEVVGNDVLDLTRQLGVNGFLVGVRAPLPILPEPDGLTLGTEIPDFTLPDLEGRQVCLSSFAPRRVLLINWSAGCGYCVRTAPVLAELRPALDAAAVEIVLLVAHGDPEQNQALLEEHGLDVTLLLANDEESFESPFGNQGTPVAYLLDEHRRTASALSIGAFAIPALAREVAGLPPEEPESHDHDHDHDHDGDDGHDAHDGAEPEQPVPDEDQLPPTPRFIEEPVST